MRTQDQHVQGLGLKCPVCASENIEGESVEIDAGTAWQDMSCGVCGSSWRDLYHLAEYVDLKRGVQP